MNRRCFLISSLGLTAGEWLSSQLAGAETVSIDQATKVQSGKLSASMVERKLSRYSHKLPFSDQNYQRSRNYIEDEPVDEYTWASDEAYEAFQDIRYGVRIHWGLYSIWHLSGESWPFLGNRKPDINL